MRYGITLRSNGAEIVGEQGRIYTVGVGGEASDSCVPRARDTDRPQTGHMHHITLLNSLQEMASLELTC